ncbi:MAG: hypothetical protein RBR34_08805 [Rhodospirillaceae bacterium]|nr:hypothetical protein [Rhodospirillaceae bacterium]
MSARHEMTHAGISFRQGWRFSITPFRLVLMAISAISLALIMFRLITGLGLVTNLNDSWPWAYGFPLTSCAASPWRAAATAPP